MEQGSGPNYQQERTDTPDEMILPGIQQEQSLKQAQTTNGEGKSARQESARQEIETLWKDFWHIPLKDRLVIWMTFLLLIVGIATAWIFFGQLDIMQDTLTEIRGGGDQTERLVIASLGQIAAANRSMQVSERAQISVIPKEKNVLTRGAPISIEFTFNNIGKTVAKNIHIKVVIAIIDKGSEPDFLYEPTHQSVLAFTGTLFPGDPFSKYDTGTLSVLQQVRESFCPVKLRPKSALHTTIAITIKTATLSRLSI